MFSKQEAAALRKQFWISFGKSFPRKWILYNTKIKDVSFKFYANNKQALVCLDIESNDEIKNQLLYDQLGTLKNILQQEYIPAIVFDANYTLEKGLKELTDQGVDEVYLMPLYPQFAMATTETILVRAEEIRTKNYPEMTITPLEPFYNHQQYIKILSESTSVFKYVMLYENL